MIIANALKRLFNGVTAEIKLLGTDKTATIKYWYGDQKELITWITEQNKKSTPDKYPLVWYLLNDYTEHNGWYITDAKLVIMQDTRLQEMNDWRNSNSYEGILEPVWQVVKSKLTSSNFVNILSNDLQTRFKLRTEPNFGIGTNTPDLKSLNNTKEKSIQIDLIDCIIVDFKLRIKCKCII
jgi:hypothetical protein